MLSRGARLKVHPPAPTDTQHPPARPAHGARRARSDTDERFRAGGVWPQHLRPAPTDTQHPPARPALASPGARSDADERFGVGGLASAPPAARRRSPNIRRSSQRTRPAASGSTQTSVSTRPASLPNTFGPTWLAAKLATLIPGYPDTPLCVALSGGVDSTALLAGLAAIHPRPPNLRALHVDHGLRPASRGWAQHCRALARRLRVPLKVLTTKVDAIPPAPPSKPPPATPATPCSPPP